ncbi:MAG: response regulator [Candidatus Bathyarchaeota archaeon]|nr:response regulator [Candidatus Bathyarchaeota archaeon]
MSSRHSLPVIKVLFIDDEPMFLALLKPIIQSFDPNLHVDTLSNPHKVMDAVTKNHYDCAIVDYYMPGMSGLNIIKRIKSVANIPCILYTGMSVEEVQVEVEGVDVDAIMGKIDNPNDYTKLTGLIRDTINEHKKA